MTDAVALEITNVISGYCQAYDDRDQLRLEVLLHPRCHIDLVGGRFDGQSFAGRQTVVDWLVGTWAETPPCLHLTGNVRLEMDDGKVTGVSDYVLFVRRDGGWEVSGRGRYLDAFQRPGGRWVLARRTVVQPT